MEGTTLLTAHILIFVMPEHDRGAISIVQGKAITYGAASHFENNAVNNY